MSELFCVIKRRQRLKKKELSTHKNIEIKHIYSLMKPNHETPKYTYYTFNKTTIYIGLNSF